MFKSILNKYVKSNDYSNPETRRGIANLQGISSIIINIVIFIMKFVTGLLIHSISLIADAFHTLSDILSSIIIMIGFKFASKPADISHPFGHQRIEAISGIIVSVLLIVTGIEFIRFSIDKIMNPSISTGNLIIIIIIITTILFKEILARFALFLGKTINSPAIMADFWHHRTDAISSIFVIIAIIFSYYNMGFIDGYMGIIVSLMIIYSGIKVLSENSNELIGKPPERKLLDKINIVSKKLEHKGLKGTHDIILNYYGNKIIGSIHIEIEEDISLMDAHTLSEEFEDEVMNETGIFITAHIDPINTHNPIIQEIRNILIDCIKQFKDIDSVHDIRLIGSDKWLNIAFDLSVKELIDEKRKTKINEIILETLKVRFNNIHGIVIKFEPLFSY